MDYRPPRPPLLPDGTENPAYEKVVEAYVRQFGGFSDEVVDRGMDEWERSWTGGGWPKIGQLYPYMIDAQRELRPALEKPKEPKPWEEIIVPEHERVHPDVFAEYRRMLASGEILKYSTDEGIRLCRAKDPRNKANAA